MKRKRSSFREAGRNAGIASADAWRRRVVHVGLLVMVGAVVYLNSFTAAFVFDDRFAILNNPHVRHLWPLSDLMTHTTRPLVNLSFAINYALGGLNVWGYHLVNVTVHVLAAVTLYGLVRRTLLTERLRSRYAAAAPWLAFTAALLWMVHPLQTQSVTYISQRAEALMGLFYLLVLYSLTRGAMSRHPRRWAVAAILACTCGMASKPVMVTAPLLALLYDRAFLAGSIREAWRQRRGLYLGLAMTWGILAIWLGEPHESTQTAGFGIAGVGPLEYARTQPGVVLHYLRLAFWPHPLVLDYGWPVASTIGAIMPSLVAVGAFVWATWRVWRAHPPLGFLGVWFLLILAPSSSVIPIADLAFEHRMYLPLAGLVVLVVLSGDALLRRGIPAAHLRQGVATGLVAASLALLGALTVRRNADYRSELAIWRDAVAKRPLNARAHESLGLALVEQGWLEGGIARYEEALRLRPTAARAHNNLGMALAKQGKLEEAVARFRKALELAPDYATAHNNLGMARAQQGRLPEAVIHYTEALRLRSRYWTAHNNLGLALAGQGKDEEAIERFRIALRLEPDYADAHAGLGVVLARQEHLEEALTHLSRALVLKPDSTPIANNLANVLAQQGKLMEASAHYGRALDSNPDFVEAHNNLGVLLIKQGKPGRAVAHFQRALQVQPESVELLNNLGLALAAQGKLEDAAATFSEVLRLQPGYAQSRHNLAHVQRLLAESDGASER